MFANQIDTVTIRALRHDDLPGLRRLIPMRAGLSEAAAEKRFELVKWAAFHNPYADSEATYYVAEDKGHIIGHLGRMPTNFAIDGNIVKGYFIHDLFVHPEYREKGYGFFITNRLYNIIEENTESFCCLIWTSPVNLEIQRRREYVELAAGRYVKILNPIEKLNKYLKPNFGLTHTSTIISGLLSMLEKFIQPRNNKKIEIVEIDRFDSAFDEFNGNLKKKNIGICSLKSSKYLNWKYTDRPYSKFRTVAAVRQGRICGYLVMADNVKKSYPEGAIVDIMADFDDSSAVSALIENAIDYYRSKRVFSIECIVTDKRLIKPIRKRLFLRAKQDDPVMLANLKKCTQIEKLIAIENWHLTYGESDEFLLRP